MRETKLGLASAFLRFEVELAHNDNGNIEFLAKP